MARQCPEDFNPWPPFVDIFASVILVMLLFLLITIVNIGYYAQFKFKTSYTASVVTKAPIQPEEQSKAKQIPPPPQRKLPPENSVSFHKIKKPMIDKEAKDSFFSGGKSEGNAVSYAINKAPKAFLDQKAVQNRQKLIITFEDKEIFLNTKIRSKIRNFIENAMRKNRKSEFTVTVSDPKTIVSRTISKQISLGRSINIKNQIKKSRVPNKQIHLDLRSPSAAQGNFGSITIESYIP